MCTTCNVLVVHLGLGKCTMLGMYLLVTLALWAQATWIVLIDNSGHGKRRPTCIVLTGNRSLGELGMNFLVTLPRKMLATILACYPDLGKYALGMYLLMILGSVNASWILLVGDFGLDATKHPPNGTFVSNVLLHSIFKLCKFHEKINCRFLW